MEVRLSEGIATERRLRLLAEDPEATFFHTPTWSGFLEETFDDHRTRVLVAVEDGEDVAFLPYIERARLGLRLLESMPFGTYGGPVVGRDAPRGTAAALVEAFASLARSPGVAMAQMVDVSGRTAGEAPGLVRETGTMQVVDLTEGYEAALARFRPSARNKLRKASKAGVTVRRASGRDDFLAYHGLLAESARRWGAEAPHDDAFFERLADVDDEGVQMWLAEHEGRVIGGDLNFAYGRMIMNWGNASSDAGRKHASNNMLHAHAMRVGAEAGFEVFNMGASRDLPGVRAFKASLGASDVEYMVLRATSPLYRAAQWAARVRR
ncbi:MAG: GNAT family N-acetyltransferase [Candidatus Eisenbacteria bacterium]|nr:GNAT family N-acetyltransferase [Candidatus Eisenbacteria bacterium]